MLKRCARSRPATFKIAQANDCGGWGLRNEANGQSNNGTWVAWQFNAAPNTIFRAPKAPSTTTRLAATGTMTSGSGSPGYSSVGTGAARPLGNTGSEQHHLLRDPGAVLLEPVLEHRGVQLHHQFLRQRAGSLGAVRERVGEALDGGVVSGVQTINATVNDSGGGIRSIVVYVNGIASAAPGTLCSGSRLDGTYSSLKPCPDSSGSRAIQLDTEHGPGWVNGANDVQICGYDVGGQPVALHSKDGAGRQLLRRSSGGTAATSLDSGADVGGQLRRRAQVTSNEAPVIRGTLTSGGAPVSGATVCVYQTTDLPDAARELATTGDDAGERSLRDPAGSRSLANSRSGLPLQHQAS